MGKMEALYAALFTQVDKIATDYVKWYPNRSGAGKANVAPTGPHYRIDVLIAGDYNVGIEETSQVRGVLQVKVMAPPDGGTQVTARELDKILAAFPRNLRLKQDGFTVNFDRQGYAGPGFPDGAWYATPVTLPFNLIS